MINLVVNESELAVILGALSTMRKVRESEMEKFPLNSAEEIQKIDALHSRIVNS